MKRFFSWLRGQFTRRRVFSIAFVGLLFLILAVGGVQAWEWSNSSEFCAEMCHDVHPEEVPAYQDSYHAQVECVECHLSRGGILQNVFLKASHLRHLPEALLGQYGRPVHRETLSPTSESCERCHFSSVDQGDKVLEIRRFGLDKENTEKRTYLILKIGGGEKDESERGMGYGIHWHAVNRVEYIAADERKQDIPWVRATLPDGRTVEYDDVTDPLSAEEIAGTEKRVMDCVDCHNRVGHPFLHPERLLDKALAEDRLSYDLPFVKREMLDLLTANYPSQEAALTAVEPWKAQYKTTYPRAASTQAAVIERAAEVAQELVSRLVFEKEGITWQSFIDDGGHDKFPGCFRCHDGKHLSPEGESIRLHCNICHSIPVVMDPGGDPPDMPAASLEEPASHLEANFMADHRFQANDVCTECHGPNTFGTDNSTFCANSTCHRRAWPAVDLNAAFPHPVELEGKHAEAWCHDCHVGERKPVDKCANCHEPAMLPHFGDVCEDCHTPDGFELADASGFEHPVALEGAHIDLTCSACHTAGQTLTFECVDCHQPPRESHFAEGCEDCHTPVSFEGAELPLERHPVPLIGRHEHATCGVCHAEGQRVPEYVCSNCHQPSEDHLPGACHTCHTPEGWIESAGVLIVAQSPQMLHKLDGFEDCLACHDPAGKVKPVPEKHAGFAIEQCTLCHKAVP